MTLNHYEKQIYQLLSEADKYYARDPEGKKISVFTDKDNYQDAVKGGYEAVDSAEAEAELAGQKSAEPAEKPEPTDAEPAEKPQPKQTKIAADPFADKDGEEPSDSPEARLEKIDSEIADIEKQREILKQYMTSSGGGGVSSSRIDQLEKEDKELVAKWRELKQARMDLDGPVYGDDATEEPKGGGATTDPLDANGWYTERADKNETWAHIGGIEPRSRTMSREEMEASGISMRELEQNYDPIPKDAGDAVVDSYEGYNQRTGRVVQMLAIRFEDGTTYFMETALHHHGTNAAWPDGEEYYDGRMKKLNFRSTRPKDYESRGMAPTESGIHKSRAIHSAFGVEPRHGDDYLTRPDEKQESIKPFKSQYNRLFESIGKI